MYRENCGSVKELSAYEWLIMAAFSVRMIIYGRHGMNEDEQMNVDI